MHATGRRFAEAGEICRLCRRVEITVRPCRVIREDTLFDKLFSSYAFWPGCLLVVVVAQCASAMGNRD